MNTALGVGSLAGAFVAAAFVTRRRLAGGFALGILLATAPLALTAAFSTLAPAIVLVGIMGVGAILVQINSDTLLQRSADNEVLGRVFAVLGSLILGLARARLSRRAGHHQLARVRAAHSSQRACSFPSCSCRSGPLSGGSTPKP